MTSMLLQQEGGRGGIGATDIVVTGVGTIKQFSLLLDFYQHLLVH